MKPAAKKAKGNDGEERTTKADKSQPKNNSSETSKGDDKIKGDEEHGQPGNATRLPKEGQKVFWRASPGWCEGSSTILRDP